MKKILLMIVISYLALTTHAQVSGTARTLSPGKINIGIMPTINIYDGDNNAFLFLQAGIGLTSGIDLGVRLGVLNDKNYIGGDLEFALNRNFSLSGGFHVHHDFGLDFTGLFTIPLSKSARFSSGLDMDIILLPGDNIAPVWIPINVEVDIKRNMAFMLEADIDTKLLDASYPIVSAGLQFYF